MGPFPAIRGAAIIIGILVLALAAGAAVIVWTRRRSRTGAAKGQAGIVGRDATVVFRAEHRGGTRPAASYIVELPDDDGTYLIPLEGDEGTPGQPIPIQGQSLTIGRDHARAQIVFTDPSVSRLHARLVEKVEGVFLLHDEGSASGTIVNDQRIEMQPRRLHSGDFIEFGRQQVIFQSMELLSDIAARRSQE
jgi:hypothetical protein